MDLGTILGIAGLLAVTALLWSCLSTLSGLFSQFGLLDRENRLARLRAQLRTAMVVTAAAALAFPILTRDADAPVAATENPELEAVMDRAERAEIENQQLIGKLRKMEVAVEQAERATTPSAHTGQAAESSDSAAATPDIPPPPPGSEPDVAPVVATVPAPSPDWRAAAVTATGDVTLRAWPNGRQIRPLAPGTRLFTNQEVRSAGDYAWVRVKTESGQIGWVVERFVTLEDVN